MSRQVSQADRQILEEKLDKALDEAWSKVNIALDQVAKGTKESQMSVWSAAEATEFASLLFNLSNGLSDFDPPVDIKKKENPPTLIQNSVDALRKAREKRHESVREAYTNIRTAADSLKTAYVAGLKKPVKPKKPR